MPDLNIDLRPAMSLYPTGVCIVTTETENHAAFGMTVNSFTSLSLNPPLVMWNLQRSSDTFKSWRDAEYFTVNMLKADQQDLAEQYAGKNNHELGDGDFKRGMTGCPHLTDYLAILECKIHARHEEGDHVIMIGEVVSVETNTKASPLTYLGGGYGTIGGT